MKFITGEILSAPKDSYGILITKLLGTGNREREFLEKAEVKINKASLRERISRFYDVFTQGQLEERRKNVLESILNSIHVISQEYWNNQENPFLLTSQPVLYIPSRVIKITETYFNKKGYLEPKLLIMLGDINAYLDAGAVEEFGHLNISDYDTLESAELKVDANIAADAVAAFYLEDEFAGYGLPTRRDYTPSWIVNHFIHLGLQMKKTREASYRLGNLAREKEREKEGTGLQFIYEQIRREIK